MIRRIASLATGLLMAASGTPALAGRPASGSNLAREQALSVPSPPGPLSGTLTLPAGKGPFPAVVLIAGSGPNDRDETVGPNKPFRDLAQGLAAAGIASLRYDKRTLTYAKQLAGKPITIDEEVTDDAVAALRLLREQKTIDPQRVFVLGNSLGALMAPRIGERDPRVAGLILLSAPVRFGLDTIVRQVGDMGRLQGLAAEEVARKVAPIVAARDAIARADPAHPPTGDFFHAPAAYWLSLRDYDAIETAKTLRMPMLVLQGGDDFQVSAEHEFSQWRAAFAHDPRVQLHLYPGLSHIFTPAGNPPAPQDIFKAGHVDATVIHDIARWITAVPRRS